MSNALKLFSKLGNHIYKNNSNYDKFKIGGALSLMVGSKYLNVQVPLYLKNIVNDANELINHNNLSDTLNNIDLIQITPTIPISIIASYGIIRSSAYGFQELRNIIFSNVSDNTIRNISKVGFYNILQKPPSYHTNNKIGIITNTIYKGNKGIRYLLNSFIFNIIPLGLEIFFVSNILLSNYDYKFTIITLGTIAIYGGYTITITQWRTQFLKNKLKYENESNGLLTDSLMNYETIKYFNNEKYEATNYEKSIEKYQLENQKIIQSLSLLNFGQNVIFSSSLVISLALCYNEIIYNNMSIGDIVLIHGLLLQLMTPLNFLGSVYRETNQALIDSNNLFKLLDDANTKEININKNTEKYNNYLINSSSNDEAIIFDNVSFGYDSKNVLNNLNFVIKNNTKNAFIGESGCGKSSIFKLLYKFYEPNSGNIYINNKNIKNLDNNYLRSQIAIIPQEINMFNDSLKYNLCYGKFSNMEYNEIIEMLTNDKINNELINILEISQLQTKLQNNNDFLNMNIGERGMKLSGGEKQRLALARGLILERPFLFADEPFSALDYKNEKKILSNNVFDNKTSLIITHNTKNLDYYDKVIKL